MTSGYCCLYVCNIPILIMGWLSALNWEYILTFVDAISK